MNSNAKVTVNQMVFRNLYFRYRDFVTPLATILVCLLLFWFVVIPQMQSWLQMRDNLATDSQDLQVMHQNLSLLTSLDDAKLNQMLTVTTTALPAEKDFAGIISSIQNAAALSGANLGDYSFQLGDLSGLDQNGKPSQTPLQLNVVLKGSVSDAQRFALQLKKQLPLSDTISIAVSSNQSITVTVVFYYASIPKIVFQDSRPLPVLGSSDTQLLQALAGRIGLEQVTTGTSSATPTPSITVSPTPTILTPTPTAATSSAATSSAF